MDDLASWPDRLQHAVDGSSGMFQRVFVLRETDSTQDAARRMKAVAGDVITTGRQTAGRGRLGRRWADTADAGIAVTMVVEVAESRGPEWLAVAAAVGAAEAAEATLGLPVGIKWPNDILVSGRKLAGVLIEAASGVAMIGIGMNVNQEAFPPEIAERAISMRQVAANAGRVGTIDRAEVLVALLRTMSRSLRMSEQALVSAFSKRDVLAGSKACFVTENGDVEGIVQRVQPLRGLLVMTGRGEVWLPAATTSVQP